MNWKKEDKKVALKLGIVLTSLVIFGILIGMDLILHWLSPSLIAILVALIGISFARRIDDDMRKFYKRHLKKSED